jgi:hypothetical protein
MGTNTPNLNLVKPAAIEDVDVTTLNSNWDKIDAAYLSLNGQRVYQPSGLADVTNTTTTLATVLSFPVQAQKVYIVDTMLVLKQSSAQSTQLKYLYTGGATEDATVSKGAWTIPAPAVSPVALSSAGAVLGPLVDTSADWTIKGMHFIKSTADGTVNLQFAGVVANTLIARGISVAVVSLVF